MVNIFEAILLAIVQGLTEWFPISSSGHLVIFQEFLSIQASVAFDVMLHFGTFLSVLVYMRKDIVHILRAILTLSEGSKIAAYLIAGSIPMALIGFLFKNYFESLFSSLLTVGLALMMNGFVLYLTKYSVSFKKIDFINSLLVGIAQVFAIIPGISRSGSTISAAMIRGVDKESAYKYSFLLSAIAILGASLFEFGDLDFAQTPTPIIFVAVCMSAIVGYVALKITSTLVLKGDFYKFSYYCVILGAIVTATTLLL